MTSGRGQINDAELNGIVQTDDMKCGHVLVNTDPALAITEGEHVPLVSVKEMRLMSDEGAWSYFCADSLADAEAADADDWYPVLPNVEENIPVDQAHLKIFVKVDVGSIVLHWKLYGFRGHQD
jgi:hypothetical protein